MFPELHTPSLVAAYTTTTVTLLGMAAFGVMVLRVPYRWSWQFVGVVCLSLTSSLLLAGRGTLPLWASLSLANVAGYCTAALGYVAVCGWASERPRYLLVTALGVVVGGVFFTVEANSSTIVLRQVTISASIMVVQIMSIRMLLNWQGPDFERRAAGLLSSVLGLYVVLLVVRFIGTLNYSGDGGLVPLASSFFIIKGIIDASLTVSFLLLVISRSLSDNNRLRLQIELHRDHLSEQVADRTRHLEDALATANAAMAARTSLMTNVSHELRTPLHAILSFHELLGRRLSASDDEKAKRHLGHIGDSARRLLHLINDLLDLARIDAGRLPVQIQPVPLGQVLRPVIAELDAMAGARRIRILTDGRLDPVMVMADAERLMQVLRNVLANAMRFAPTDSTIELGVGTARLSDEQGERLHLTIRDHGKGIPPGEEERIFEAFVQSSSHTPHSGGTGLGLAICRRIMTALGGAIRAGNHPQGGAVFHIQIPLVASGPEPAPPEASASGAMAQSDASLATENGQQMAGVAVNDEKAESSSP